MKNPFRQLGKLFSLSLFLLGFVLSFPAAGQTGNDYSIFNYSVDKGLSQSTVYSIFQDSRGFIWIGTRGGGLNCFDGYGFKVYRSRHDDPTTISGNEVVAIYEDRRGSLWVGNRISGLDRFDIDSEQFKHYTLQNIVSGNISVNCFLEDKTGRLWMGCDSGLYVYDHEADSFARALEGEKIQVSALCEMPGGEVLIGSRNGIYSLASGVDHAVRIALIDPPANEPGRAWNATMIIDSKNNIWFGGLNGLYLLSDVKKGEAVRNPTGLAQLENVHIRALMEDRNGFLWVGSQNGLVRIDPVSRLAQVYSHNDNDPESLGHNSVYSIMEDELGNIWTGTWSGGITMLSYLPRKFQVFRHIPFSNSLSNNLVSSFAEKDGGLWIGTEGGGLNYYDPVTRQYAVFRKNGSSGITSDHIKCVLKDSENTIWAGTWGKGIFRYSDKTGKFTGFLENQNVFTLCEDLQGYLWAGTLNGLYRIERKTGNPVYFSPQNKSGLQDYFITSLFCDYRGNLWVGTKSGGVHLFDPVSGKFISFRKNGHDSTGLIDNYIICMNQDNEHNLWIGTNKGLCRYDYQKKSFEDYSGKAGFPDLVINGIVPDDSGNFWISSNNGLSCYSPATGNIRNFDVHDGLQSNEFTRGSFFKKNDREILFGGINGFISFIPEKIRYNNNQPRIVITELKLFNQPVKADHTNKILKRHISFTDHIRLNYKQSFIEIDFVALNYLNPSKNRYKYKLEGYNKEWINLGTERKITFMNLREGDYVFRVTGSNNDGIWNEKGATLDITILPPLWRTRIAYLGYIVLILLSVFLLQRFMTYRIEQKNLIRMERTEKERNEELNRAKLQFFTNITHELKTPLSLISGPVDMLMKENTDPEQKTFYYRIIRNNISRLKRLVDQIIEFRKAENEKLALRVQSGNLYLFLHSLYENFIEYANRKGIDFQFRSDIAESEINWFDHDFLDKIIFNLLSNAFKFTPSGGQITMKAEIGGNMATVSVDDTGKGIDREILPGIFDRLFNYKNPQGITGSGIGLYLSKRLVETHKGSITAVSEPDRGSAFTIRFPVDRESYSEEEIHPAEKVEIPDGNDLAEYTGTDIAATMIPPDDEVRDDRRTILVVDDNHEMVASLGTFLSKKYHIRSAYDGREAIRIAREKLPDLIISDLKMPEMDGLELCDKIKSDALINHIPVIILTARTGLENQIEGLSKGADAYLEKPFDFVYLETVADNIISQRENLRKRFALENTGFKADLSDSPAEIFMEKALEKVTRNIADPLFSVEELCGELNMSRSQLFRKFRALTGMSPSDFIRVTRLRKAALLLLKENAPVSQVAEEVGFTSTSHFISAFKKLFGTTPKQYISAKKGFYHP